MPTAKKHQILTAVIEYLTRQPGAPLEDIAHHAGISRTTLFRYFPSREQLFQEIIRELETQIRTRMTPVLEEQIPAIDMLHKIVETIIRHNVQFNFLLYEPFIQQDPVNQQVINNGLHMMKRLIGRLQQEGVLRQEINTHWAAKAMQMLLWGMGESVHGGDVAINGAARMLIETFLSGFGDHPREA